MSALESLQVRILFYKLSKGQTIKLIKGRNFKRY